MLEMENKIPDDNDDDLSLSCFVESAKKWRLFTCMSGARKCVNVVVLVLSSGCNSFAFVACSRIPLPYVLDE
jgi:hypothetical protein